LSNFGFKHLASVFVCGGLLLLQPAIGHADTLTPVTIDCGDGSPMSGAVDLSTLASLQASIQGMVDNPAGLSCSLSQLALADPLSASKPGGFVVGGGRYDRDVCPLNFGLSAHIDSAGIGHGTQTLSANNSNPDCGGTGHVKANVTCVAISLDGRWVAAGADDGSVTVWNVADRQVAAVLKQHAQAIMSVA